MNEQAKPSQPGPVEEDLVLVDRVLAGDPRSFEPLVRRHERRVFRVTVAILGNIEDAEEAMQDSFIKAFRHLGQFRRESRIAVTMDDPSTSLGRNIVWRDANRAILDTLKKWNLKIALFVCGMRVDSPQGKELLGQWDEAGHLICNHSYSHLNFNGKTSYTDFAADFERNEPLIKPYRRFTRLFRYPFLKEGDTPEKRDQFRALLKQKGYSVGHVTVDGSDWYVDERMNARLEKQPAVDTQPYGDYLVAHLLDRAAFYRQLAVDVLDHEIPHTLLLHHRMINALYLEDVISAFSDKGWQWIDARRAFDDAVFKRQPQIAPAGESLVWALAKESGRFEDRLRYPGEDDAYEKPHMDTLGL